MGYEHRLFIVDGDETGYQQVIARIDISRHDDFACKVLDLFTETLDGYIYADNGNETITHDKYGESLKFTRDFRKLANFLEQDNDNEYYRRLPHVIAMLRAFNKADWQDLKVIHYGY